MTGAAATAVGARLLGKLAVPAAKKLGSKLLFRRRVAHRVDKGIDFQVPWAAYRAWLKNLSADELSTPVEEISASLAARLDEGLCAASKPWRIRPDHLSRALTLVERTYPAIVAALGEPDRAQRQAEWADARSARVLDLLAQTLGPDAALSSGDLAEVLLRRSRARREVRLQAFGLHESDVTTYFAKLKVPKIAEGQLLVLQGDFGSGKSETAESWHRIAIETLRLRQNSPVPVWLKAAEVNGRPLELAIDEFAGTGWRRGRGAAIVIDGLDEVGNGAGALLDAARVLIRTHVGLRVLLTSRPGMVKVTDEEAHSVALLEERDAVALAVSLSDNQRATWQWTSNMKHSLRRPFFALAAGVLLEAEEAPPGEADLVRALVEQALERASERAAITTTETFDVLVKLAVSLTERGTGGLTFAEQQTARTSRLVDDGPAGQGGVVFTLPIFEQWFAAQALLSRVVDPCVVVADCPSFRRWQWAAAVAALSAPDADALDDLMATWVQGNAGAAGWILKQTFGRHDLWRRDEVRVLDTAASAERLLRALRCFVRGLGPLSAHLPLPGANGPVGVGAATSGNWIHVAISTATPAADSSRVLEPEAFRTDSDWLPWFSTSLTAGYAWPWMQMRKVIASATLKMFNTDAALGAADGVWTQERRYNVAQHVMNRTGLVIREDFPAEAVRAGAATLYDRLGQNPDGSSTHGGSRVTGAEVEGLIAWIDTSGATIVESTVPPPDVLPPPTAKVIDMYSTTRLMEFEAQVYGRACEAYDEGMEHAFSSLGWSMPGSGLRPFGVYLEFSFGHAGRGGDEPFVTVFQAPMPLLDQWAQGDEEVVWSANRRAVATVAPSGEENPFERHNEMMETLSAWITERGREVATGIGRVQTGAHGMTSPRPASAIAARWLWDDLKFLGLGDGTFPQLK